MTKSKCRMPPPWLGWQPKVQTEGTSTSMGADASTPVILRGPGDEGSGRGDVGHAFAGVTC